MAYSTDNKEWEKRGQELNTSILSDDYCNGFTGAFFGICAQDMLYHGRSRADFDYFHYQDLQTE